MDVNDITDAVIGAAIAVHQALGPGLLESAYETCHAYELTCRKVGFERQKELPVVYKGVVLDCGYRLDLLVEKKVIVELKSVIKLDPIHEAQMLTYLKLTGCSVGLIINFNVPVLRDGVRRIVHRYTGPAPFSPRLRGE